MKKLTKNNYKVVKSTNTGNVVVTPPNGFTKVFNSINEAVKFYF